MSPLPPQLTPALSPVRILLLCGLVVSLAMGIRHGFGLWLQPVTTSLHWNKEHFSFAIALQNISWGVFGVFAGMLADRFGAYRVILASGFLYALGLATMAYADTPFLFALAAGVVIGMAQAGTTYAVVYGVINRNLPAAKRSWAMGVTAAAGSFGQFLMVPLENQLIVRFGWDSALLWLGFIALFFIPLALMLREPQFSAAATPRPAQSVKQAFFEALSYPSFQLLMLGYFVCGFQVVFVAVHLPSYLLEQGFDREVGGHVLSLIGLFNILGTYSSGWLGQRMPKHYILSFIYFSRALVIIIFLSQPLSTTSLYLFASVLGFLWLSTVPPTNAIVAQIFGISHVSMLSGMVFLSHQMGSFMGVWLGGYLYDSLGDYQLMWGIAIALGFVAGIASWFIRESPLPRLQNGLHNPVPA